MTARPSRPRAPQLRRRCILEQLEDRRMLALAPTVLADINTQPDFNSSIPQHFTEYNGETYFVANGYASSSQTVWKSDGTAAGTRPLLDSARFDGEDGKTEGPFVEFNGKLVFPAYSAEHGVTIWETNGTYAETRIAAETAPGPEGGGIEGLTNVNGTLFFSAYTPSSGVELWKWDGVSETAVLVKERPPGSNTALTPRQLTNVNGELYFLGYQEKFGDDYIYKSDGTAEGTVVLADVEGDTGYWEPGELTNLNGRLLFSGSNPYGLWITDGTSEGTYSLLPDYGDVSDISIIGDLAYFWVGEQSGTRSLWRSDGTQAGTKSLFNAGSSTSQVDRSIVGLGDSIYFLGRNGNNANVSTLWKLDPATDVTTEVAFSFDGYFDLSVFQDKLYFFGSDDLGLGLWTSDGTEAGTYVVDHFIASGQPISYMAPGELFIGSNQIFIGANDKVHGHELWTSDGTDAGTGMLKDLIGETDSSRAGSPVVVNGTAYFFADDGIHGQELWKSDSTAGTMLVADITPGKNAIGGHPIANLNGVLLFRMDSGLWRSDGTAGGTVKVKGIGVFSEAVIDGILYFKAPVGSGNQGFELWRSDGTTEGTFLISDVRPGNSSSGIPNYAGFKGEVYFAANDGTNGYELWKTNGEQGNLQQVSNFATEGKIGAVQEFRGSLYFTRLIPGAQIQIWKTDGNWETATIVKTIDSPSFNVVTEWLATPDRLYFFNNETLTNETWTSAEVWTTDGTAAGTYLLRDDVSPWRTGSQLNLRATLGGKVFFTADDGVHGVELWTSDGTVAGTRLVKDVRPGERGSDPTTPLVAGGQLYYSAIGPAGRELWRTDGTEAGTQQAADFRFGNSFIHPGAVLGGSLLIPALGDRFGWEMWKVDLNDLPQMQGGVPGTFVEDGGPVAVTPQALVSDVDNTTFARGSFTVQITGNLSAGDRIWLRSHGSGATRLAVNAAELRYGGVLIGTLSRGTGGASLRVFTNSNCSLPALRAILRGVSFFNARQDVPTATRTVRYTLNDGDGPGLTTLDANVHIVPRNDAPVLDNSLNPLLTSVREDALTPATTLVSDLIKGAVSDPDSGARRGIAVTAASNYHGTWRFSIDGGKSWQRVGNPTESAARLLPGWARLKFTPKPDFHGVVRMYYRAWDQTQGTPGGRFDLVGNTGGTRAFSAAKESAALIVKPINDKPVVALGGTIGYTRDTTPITLAPNAGVRDVDSSNFYNGRLRVRITDGASISNRLFIGAGFTVDANNNVLQGTTIIGKRASSGFGTKELIITFNYKVTPAIAQQLVRAIAFKTVGGTAGQRTIVFTVSDGDGGLSDEATKLVNVT